MRVDVTPRHAEAVPGVAQAVTVTITNTSQVIGGYTIRILGADPGWVQLETDQISLFPDESRTVNASITPPRGIPAGSRRIAVQVRELTPPHDSTIHEIDLTVPSAAAAQMRVDPIAVTAGHRANFSLLVENTGNTIVSGYLAGDDPEGKVSFGFTPEGVTLSPGEHALVDMRASARRHVTGSPTVRMLAVYLDEASPEAFFGIEPTRPPARDERAALANATFVQKSVLTRGPLALLGLLAAVTVFALVITFALSRLVGQSTADRDLALQIAAAQNSNGSGGSSSIGGVVRQLTNGTPQSDVTVSVFDATDTSNPLVTTATDQAGKYRVSNLAAGKYKISYGGAGFVQLWYPNATDVADASTIALGPKTSLSRLDVTLGGVPATINGTVIGEDVSASTLYLERLPRAGDTPPTGITAPAANGAVPPPDNGDAVVQSVPIGSDGTFTLTDVPSPATYDLVVTKAGFATTTQRIDVGAGETRRGIQLTLSRGDGLISGTVNSGTGPQTNVTITATSGQSSTTTVSVSGTGAFTLRNLPTPASFTVVARKAGFASQTQTLALTSGEKLTGVQITLAKSSGSLQGTAFLLSSKQPVAGVAVTVTGGSTTVETGTQSQSAGTGSSRTNIGDWKVDGLPIPGTYTVTLTRADLETQTVAVSLNAAGNITPGSRGITIGANGDILVTMQSATATITGTVSQLKGTTGASAPVGEVTVTASSSTSSYTVVTASVPSGKTGQYLLAAVPPGTWTVSVSRAGTAPTSTIVSLSAGEVFRYSPKLQAPASISGTVSGTDEQRTPRRNWVVQLYEASQYPDVVAYSTTTDSLGRFRFPDVNAPQVYVVVARPTIGSAQVVSKTVQIAPSQTIDNIKLVGDPNG
jgi:hypothetical protein